MAKNPLVGTPVVDKKRVEDLVLWEIEQRYCRTAVELDDGEYQIGELVEDATIADSGAADLEPTFADVLLLENITVPEGETREVAALARGPALVNLDEVVRSSDSETDGQLKTRIAALAAQGVRFVREPAVQSTPDLAG